MKSVATLLLTVSAGLALGVSVQAQSFNDRGPDFVSSVTVNSSTPRQMVTAVPHAFNDRSPIYFNEQAPAMVMPMDKYMAALGFNSRDQFSLN